MAFTWSERDLKLVLHSERPPVVPLVERLTTNTLHACEAPTPWGNLEPRVSRWPAIYGAAVPAAGFRVTRTKLDSVGFLELPGGQVPRVCHDFRRGSSCWSR